MKYFTIAILAGLGVSTSVPAAPALNHINYSVHVPASAEGCASEATTLANAFKTYDPTLQNVVGVCVGTSNLKENGHTYAIDSLSVQYDSSHDTPIAPYQAALAVDLLNDTDITSVYSSYHDCLADLPAQEATFKTATTLAVLTGSCEPEEDDPSFGYKMLITGLGDNKATLYQFESSTDADDSAWKAQLLGDLRKKGAVLAKQMGQDFFYYAPYDISLSSTSVIVTKDAASCEAQQAEAVTMLSKAGAKSVTTACHQNDEGFSLDVIDDLFGNPPNDEGAGSAVYYDFASCIADVRQMNKQDSVNFRFCQKNDISENQYQMVTFNND
jgi:hypothetical protein